MTDLPKEAVHVQNGQEDCILMYLSIFAHSFTYHDQIKFSDNVLGGYYYLELGGTHPAPLIKPCTRP